MRPGFRACMAGTSETYSTLPLVSSGVGSEGCRSLQALSPPAEKRGRCPVGYSKIPCQPSGQVQAGLEP